MGKDLQSARVSRRKMIATLGITGVATIISGGLFSKFDSQVFAASNKKKYGPITDDADRISYYYSDNQEQRTVGEKMRETISVKDFGAVGDGKTDDTESFNDAIKHLDNLGGGILFIPNEDHCVYFLKSSVVLCDNLRIISNGATLKKNGSSDNYYIFVSLSNNNQGYGSGASNLIIDGLVISGSFADLRGASITLHHSQNVWIKNCIFIESVISGHSIDLGGCSDVLISNCSFKGFNVQEGREYVEAIQIDHSTAEGIGSDVPNSYDGLACKNITIRDCEFLPLVLKGTTYPAPNPFGSHSRVVGQIFTNIKFKDNYVENGSTVPDGAPYSAGLLHFYHIDGLEITGNVFINEKRNSARVLGLYSIGTAISQSDVSKGSPTKVNYDPVPAKNVVFERNRVIGFNNHTLGRIIYLQGREINSIKYYLENISIMSNHFIDCYDKKSLSINVSSDVIYSDKVIGLNVTNNHCSSVRRLLYATSSKGVHVAFNRMFQTYYVPISIDKSTDINLVHNIIDVFRGGFYTREIDKLKIKDNSFINEIDDIASDYGQIISINRGRQFFVKDNNIEGSNSDISFGINVYAKSDGGIIKDNWITGFRENIRVNSDSTNIDIN